MNTKRKFTKKQIRMVAEEDLCLPFEVVWNIYKRGWMSDKMIRFSLDCLLYYKGITKRKPSPIKIKVHRYKRHNPDNYIEQEKRLWGIDPVTK